MSASACVLVCEVLGKVYSKLSFPLLPAAEWTVAEDMGVFVEGLLLLTIAVLTAFKRKKFIEFQRAWRVAASTVALNGKLAPILIVSCGF